jgi:hypothetical protein
MPVGFVCFEVQTHFSLQVRRSLVALRAGIIYDLASPDSTRKEG